MAYHLALQLGDMGDWKYCVPPGTAGCISISPGTADIKDVGLWVWRTTWHCSWGIWGIGNTAYHLVLQVASAFHLALQILKMWGRDMAYGGHGVPSGTAVGVGVPPGTAGTGKIFEVMCI